MFSGSFASADKGEDATFPPSGERRQSKRRTFGRAESPAALHTHLRFCQYLWYFSVACSNAFVLPTGERERAFRLGLLLVQVMDHLLASNRGSEEQPVLEVEFAGEEGVGQGPTNEFYAEVTYIFYTFPFSLSCVGD